MPSIDSYRAAFLDHLAAHSTVKEPAGLYEPIQYILDLGGKRLRPVLTLMAADLFGGDFNKALGAATAIEVFHNFSLIHDDIMDDAPLRRGHQTVHEKWDVNTGILSGDAMLIQAYRYFEDYPPELLKPLVILFSKTAMEVCEGQQYDVDFETRNDVTIPEYLKMIEYKTAVLVAAALKMGAMIAGAAEKDQDLIYRFGINLGVAFQLQDDYLDAFGNPETFGKQVGGDIIENKKTYLYLKAVELATAEDREELERLFSTTPTEVEAKIEFAKSLFETSGSVSATQSAIQAYTDAAYAVLEEVSIPDSSKDVLRGFAASLMTRKV